MTKRERNLAATVGGAVILLVAFQLVQWAVLKPYRALKDEELKVADTRAKLQKKLKKGEEIKADWQAATARTLGTKPNAVALAFREDIADLLKKHNLIDDVTMSQRAIAPQKNGFIEIPIALSVKGRLDDVVAFMCDFYERPYLAKLSRVTLAADESALRAKPRAEGKGQRGGKAHGRGGKDTDELVINITATTLVVPEIKSIPHDPPTAEPPDPPRLAKETMDSYDAIVASNFFKKYVKQEPPPPPPPVETKTQVVKNDNPPQVKRDSRPNADKMFVVGTVVTFREPSVFVRDDSRFDLPPIEYRVGDKIDDGRLVFVDGEGIVVRVSGSAPKEYFYPLGYSFKDRELLTADLHPDVYHALHDG